MLVFIVIYSSFSHFNEFGLYLLSLMFQTLCMFNHVILCLKYVKKKNNQCRNIRIERHPELHSYSREQTWEVLWQRKLCWLISTLLVSI